MEVVFALVIVVAFWALLRMVLRAFGAGARAAARTVQGKGSFKGNFGASFSGMSGMETRLRLEQVEGDHSFPIQRIEVRGLFPVESETRLRFSASVFDITETGADGKPELQPVLSVLENFQESETLCYADRTDVGRVEPNLGLVDWVSVLNLIPETLVPPRSGPRKLRVFILASDADAPPRLRNGFIVAGRPIATWTQDFEWHFEGEGYLERSEKQRRAEELTVKLAVAVAFADGAMHESEGTVIKEWMTKRIEVLGTGARDSRRDELNQAMRDAYSAGTNAALSVSATVGELEGIATPADGMAAVELCLDVLSADGEADARELRVVNSLAQQLDVDLDRFEGLKDKTLAGLSSGIGDEVDYNALLNIDPSWGEERVKKHLNRLYAQWNSRSESLQDPEKRQEAERMLEIIAKARGALLT